jgi:hypothetical protein
VIVAHIGGVPVEETLQPLMIALMLSGAWLTARARRPRARQERREGDTERFTLRAKIDS